MSSSKSLSPAEKAAIILMAVGEETAATIMRQMQPREIQRIASAMSHLGQVEASLADSLLQEFADLLTAPKPLIGGADKARALLQSALRHTSASNAFDAKTLLDLATPALTETLTHIDAKALAAYLKREHPQTIALTLAHAHAKQAGDALKLLPADMHVDIIQRIATLEPVDSETIYELEASLRSEIDRTTNIRKNNVGGAQAVAAMLNALDRDAADAQLNALETRDPELATAVRQLMFTFDDLRQLDDRGLQELLKLVPDAKLKVALKSAPDALKTRFFSNMSERKAQRLAEDIEALGLVRRAEVEAAQREVAALARQLIDDGRIIVEPAAAS